MAISGVYSLEGYAILSNGNPIYSAGNSAYDSQIYASPDYPYCVDLDTIARYCRETMDQLAEERGESLGTAIYVDNAPQYFIGG